VFARDKPVSARRPNAFTMSLPDSTRLRDAEPRHGALEPRDGGGARVSVLVCRRRAVPQIGVSRE
jgi:hypothetical protein